MLELSKTSAKMGQCFSDVNNSGTYAVGGQAAGAGPVQAGSAREGALDALNLLTGAAAYSSKVEIRVACKHLEKADVLSKSDPMAVLYEVGTNGIEKEVGRTECIAATHSPTFTVPFTVQYNFERLQPLRLLIVDIDSGQKPDNIDPASCDFLGELHFKLSELVTAKDKKTTKNLHTKGTKVSTVTLTCEELSAAKEEVTLAFAASQLKNVERLSKSDPYLEINKSNQGDNAITAWTPVYKTEVRPNNLNPIWMPIKIRMTQLNNGDAYRPLLLKVYDHEMTGYPELIGQIETNFNNLRSAAIDKTPLTLSRPKKLGAPCGYLAVKECTVTQRPTFLDYIQAGTEISFVVAVDFTASNRSPSDPYSLHYMNPTGAMTKYEQALFGVGQVLEFYDSDRNFPAYGFGGQPASGPVSHCFPLNGQADAVCSGIAGIQQAYRSALSTWRLSGPTLFAPIIRAASNVAAQPTAHLKYNVLLILTDGEIMDMPDTIEAIVHASKLPLSILIVGIGDADFTNMGVLDSDKQPLKAHSGRIAERDIVQFVEFRNYQYNAEALAAELLAELPGQFLAYVRTRNIPLPSTVHTTTATAT